MKVQKNTMDVVQNPIDFHPPSISPRREMKKGKVEFVSETLSERIPYIYISKQPSLSFVDLGSL